MIKEVDIDIDIDDVFEHFDVDEILDEIDLEDIEDYLDRKSTIRSGVSMNNAKSFIAEICSLRYNRRLITKDVAKKVICEIIDDLFLY